MREQSIRFGSRYTNLVRTPQKTPLPTILLLLRVHIRCQGDAFAKPMPSNVGFSVAGA
jgi:hypothetical protein